MSFFSLFQKIFLFFGAVKAKIFKRMLFFSAAVALFKDFSSVFFFSLCCYFSLLFLVRAFGPSQFDDVPLDVFCS